MATGIAGDREAVRTELVSLGTATLAESGGRSLDPAIRPVWPGAAFAAPAFPVACAPGDNLAVHAAVAHAPAGCVLAVSTGDGTRRGYWGEVLTTAAEAAGVVALVTDGTVRDTAALERHAFPVFATGIGLRGASKTGPGSLGRPVVLGGVVVGRGDWLVGDADGVVTIPVPALEACLRAGRERAAKEGEMFARLRAGATTVELLGLDIGPIDIG
jgi:4-hydroxy-4-methyl-2-oxoglutarate aldolase